MNNELERLRRENEALKAQLDGDPYIKIEELGAGGFCTVWRAARRVDDHHFIEVCLKELKPHLRDDPDGVRYFRREARIASNLRHGKIPLLIDVDFARHRLVYELVDGVDLRRLLAHAGGRLACDLAILVGLEIAAALEYAHSRTREDAPAGVIHRDLTPANVLISVDGQVMLADFGVAAIESTELQTSIRGTAAYMSPEQARGRPVDAGTDLFALGVVLYELVAGRRPFDGDGDGPASFERLAQGAYPPLESTVSDTPAALTAIITRLLQPNRDARYKNASDVFSALSAIAPSHNVVRELGALVRAARKRKTKDYRTLQLSHGIQAAPPRRADSAREPQVHDAITVVRPTEDSGRTWRAAARPFSRRVKPQTIAVALGAMLLAVMFWAWPASRSRSANSPEAKPTAAVYLPPPRVAVATPSLAGVARVGMVSETDPAGGTPFAWVHPRTVATGAADGLSSPAAPVKAATAEPEADEAVIKVSADKSARVRIDGHFAGWSPLRASVAPGPHTILIGEGKRQQTIKTQVAARSIKELFVNMRDHPTD